MTTLYQSAALKILIAMPDNMQTTMLQRDLECLGHRVERCPDFDLSLRMLRRWQPDLVVTEEAIHHGQPDSGLRLVDHCRSMEDQVNGWPGTRALVLIPAPDWDRVKRAQRTGAHVIVKKTDFEAAIRYIQTIADDLTTDRLLGPALIGMHRFTGETPHPQCIHCEWIGASISYASSQTDLNLTSVRAALLNVLLFRHRGQSPRIIEETCRESAFLAKVLRGRMLREAAIKMEITRLRNDIGHALEVVGAPYLATHFLPIVTHGMKTYGLTANCRLVHIRKA